MAAGRRWGLVLLGAVLLISSVGVMGYSHLAEWQHTLEVRSSAPPAETLPDRLPIPTRATP